MSEPIPESLRRAGITGCTSNLPEGGGIDFAADFVRIFRPEIEERLYGWGEEIASNSIEVQLHRLRRKLGKEWIRNVRGIGFKLVDPAA